MTETDKALADVSRAERAKALLADPMLVGALSAVRIGVRDLFFDLPRSAVAEREELHLMDRARQHFENALMVHIHTGEIAAAVLQSEDEAAQQIDAIRERVKAL